MGWFSQYRILGDYDDYELINKKFKKENKNLS